MEKETNNNNNNNNNTNNHNNHNHNNNNTNNHNNHNHNNNNNLRLSPLFESSLFDDLPHDFDDAFEGSRFCDVEDEDEAVSRGDVETLHGRKFQLPSRVQKVHFDFNA